MKEQLEQFISRIEQALKDYNFEAENAIDRYIALHTVLNYAQMLLDAIKSRESVLSDVVA